MVNSVIAKLVKNCHQKQAEDKYLLEKKRARPKTLSESMRKIMLSLEGTNLSALSA